MKVCLLLVAAAIVASSQPVLDLLLIGGHVLDPANGRNGTFDIGILEGRIRTVAAHIPAAYARQVVDVSGYYVTPGLVDIHAHLEPGGLAADHKSLRNGVTTVVDAGSATTENITDYRKWVVQRSDTRVLAFVRPGASARGGLQQNQDIIVGFVADSDKTLPAALKAATETKLPVMLDTDGRAQSDSVFRELRAGDIYTNIYSQALPPPSVRASGVLFDGSHGGAGFWFRIAAESLKGGFLPYTISTGLDRTSVLLPRAGLTNVMSKFLALGVPLDKVVERVTVNPARAIHRPELGTIREGTDADLAVLELEKGTFAFLDSGHGRLTSDRNLHCILTIRRGEVVWDTHGLSTEDWKQAGPYSNFK